MKKIIIIGFICSMIFSSCMNRDLSTGTEKTEQTEVYYITVPDELDNENELKIVMFTDDEGCIQDHHVSEDGRVTLDLDDDTICFYTTCNE